MYMCLKIKILQVLIIHVYMHAKSQCLLFATVHTHTIDERIFTHRYFIILRSIILSRSITYSLESTGNTQTIPLHYITLCCIAFPNISTHAFHLTEESITYISVIY